MERYTIERLRTRRNGGRSQAAKPWSGLVCRRRRGNGKLQQLIFPTQTALSGGERKAGIRVQLPEAEAIVNGSTSISADALRKTLKGLGNMSARTANCLRSLIRTGGRQKADETYTRMADYLRQLEALSGGSVTDCQFDKDRHFERCFMMLGAAAFFATKGVQKALSIDAVLLKGDWNGVILTLSFKDAGNNIIHIATAVCPKENADSYSYLQSKATKFDGLRDILNNTSYTCFSDSLKGPNTALHEYRPLVEDRRCMHHILKNIPAVGQDGMMIAYDREYLPSLHG